MTRTRVATLIVPLVLLAGCKLGPDYERPKAELPKALPDIARLGSASGVVVTAAEPWQRWWEVFKDEKLSGLVVAARERNYDLRGSIARVHAARHLVEQSFAGLLPNLSANGSYTYQKQSLNGFVFSGAGGAGGAGGASFTGDPFQLWSGTLDMSYELDLWGRVRRNYEAAQGDLVATDEDRKTAEISLTATVVQAYFDLGKADADLAIARESIELRQKTLELVRGRVDAGLAAELELRRAESSLAVTQSELPEFERRRTTAENQLAVLTGRFPQLAFEGRAPATFAVPPEIPIGIPGALLERRPDIRAAEARLRASNARIGEALAGFLPTVSITGRLGHASVNLHTIEEGRSELWSIGPSIHLPIFEGGRTYARLLETESRRDESVARYYQTVLDAFREVADAIVGLEAHGRVRDRQQEAVTASQRAVELATMEYDQGLTSFLNVLDAERELLLTRQALLASQRQILSDLVQLGKALGGGWTELPAEEKPESGKS